MAIPPSNVNMEEILAPTYSARQFRAPVPRFKMPEHSMQKEAAYQLIHDELMLDGTPRLDLASFLTTWMEPECDQLVMESINKNFIEMDEYPITNELQNRCVYMIAHLFHAPLGNGNGAVGVGTVGSSEAVMLAGLAFKRKWQLRNEREGQTTDRPNIVAGANVQICWKKFAKYFDVELKLVPLSTEDYVMDPTEAINLIDKNTICVAAILGSTLTGEFENVKVLNSLLEQHNKMTGYDTPIHVDAASGGFVAPFLYPELEWDFRLPLVKSINVSGHKYGLVYPGVGWVVWRTQDDLPDDLVFEIDYLGSKQKTFTLNFSKGSSQIVAQYYQFLRLGFEGYKNIIQTCMDNARSLKERLQKTEQFDILSKDDGVPMVAFSFKNKRHGAAFRLSQGLRRFRWLVPAYKMPANIEHIEILRVVIREDFSRNDVERLVNDIMEVIKEIQNYDMPVDVDKRNGPC